MFSKFHILLGLVGVREGKNGMSFEVHRPVDTSSSEELVFDASGVFGVEVCSTVIDSYSRKDSNGLVSGSLDEMMDLDPYTTGTCQGKGDICGVGGREFERKQVEFVQCGRWRGCSEMGV